MKESLRMSRVNELLQREIADLLEKMIERHRGILVSVTEVVTTPDLKHAKVYISILGNEEQKQNYFREVEKHRILIQSAIASHIKLKYTPVLDFVLDNRIEKANKVLSIINELEQKENS
jgi:ribosome-binding factor A